MSIEKKRMKEKASEVICREGHGSEGKRDEEKGMEEKGYEWKGKK